MSLCLGLSLTSTLVPAGGLRPPAGMAFLKYTNADGQERIVRYINADNAEKRIVYTRAS